MLFPRKYRSITDDSVFVVERNKENDICFRYVQSATKQGLATTVGTEQFERLIRFGLIEKVESIDSDG